MEGLDLRIKRTKARVKGVTLARVLRETYPESYWSPSKVSKVEGLGYVEPRLADEYVAGLATLTTNATPDGAAA